VVQHGPVRLRQVQNRVARWYIFKTKKDFWVNFGAFCNGRYWYILHMAIWYILRPTVKFYGPVVNFVVIWYIFPV
jgi:hypothetical protein